MAPQRTSKVSAPLSKDNTKVKKRAPSAYNNFMATHMKTWRTEHPAASAKEAMAAPIAMVGHQIAAQWKDSPENPNRGKPSKPKKTHNKENADTSTDPSSDAVAGPSSDSY
ncbi:hypothetical protein FRC02_003044 [Tulasnella sp. 418]|nr:hypothetical protein FRC02_003044 [Tulasnella sp. 418]